MTVWQKSKSDFAVLVILSVHWYDNQYIHVTSLNINCHNKKTSYSGDAVLDYYKVSHKMNVKIWVIPPNLNANANRIHAAPLLLMWPLIWCTRFVKESSSGAVHTCWNRLHNSHADKTHPFTPLTVESAVPRPLCMNMLLGGSQIQSHLMQKKRHVPPVSARLMLLNEQKLMSVADLLKAKMVKTNQWSV